MLIVIGGLPGTGKTTIARVLCRRIGGVHLRIDTIEQALRASSMLAAEVGPAGYLVACDLAADNLRVGRTVIADCVNPLTVTRAAWRATASAAQAAIIEVEIVCSDAARHRERIETRRSDIAGLRLPGWDDVQRREYDRWDRPPVVLDTASLSPEQAVADLLLRLPRL